MMRYQIVVLVCTHAFGTCDSGHAFEAHRLTPKFTDPVTCLAVGQSVTSAPDFTLALPESFRATPICVAAEDDA